MIHQRDKYYRLKEFLLEFLSGFFGMLVCIGVVLGLYSILKSLF